MPPQPDLPRQLSAILDEHRYAERLLLLLEDEARRLKGRDVDPANLRSILEYMTRFPDRFHHRREDLIFDRLEAKRPGLRKRTAHLRRSHETLGASATAMLERLADPRQ